MAVLDAILGLRPVQYLLLFIVAALVLATGYSIIQQKLLSLQLAAAKGEKAEYAAQLLTQNAAVIKAGQDMNVMLKQVQAARDVVAVKQQQLKKRQQELSTLILTGSCDEQVQQIIDEVRR